MTPPTVLVFGATSGIGGTLLERLLPDHRAGRLRLVAAVRREAGAAGLRERGIEARLIDLDDAETAGLEPLVDVVSDVDRMFLLTGYHVRMLAQSKAAVDAAARAGVGHVVHLGAHADPSTTIVHLGWHQMIEAYLAASGVGFTNLHPTSFLQNLFLLIDVGGAPPGVLPHYIGPARTSWVDAGDIAEAAAVVLRDPAPHTGRSYLLGTEAASMPEIAAALSSVTGGSWRDEPREPEVFFRTVTAAGADPVYMACVRTIFERTREGTLPDLAETSGDLERLIGRPGTSIRGFLQRERARFGEMGRRMGGPRPD